MIYAFDLLLGYAAMYTMCTKKSCALVKESGFNTAYVIAHEAGHA